MKEKKLNIEKLKTSAINEVDARGKQLWKLSRRIHDNPEMGFKEFKALEWLTRYLEESGFRIERGVCGLPTAFRASCGKGRPSIALLAEYDALPDIGHACGHNLIGVSAVGGAVAAKSAIDLCGGTIIVLGTPAEELYGGKALMAEKGAFDNLDAVMMVHPGTHDAATTEALALHGLTVEFFGKAAHAAARPDAGINALEAMLQSYNAINSLRQHIHPKARIHGIITDGGQAANIVPAHSSAIFLVRAANNYYLELLKQRVLNCFTGAATATGARLEYKWDNIRYDTLLNNIALARAFTRNMGALGRKIKLYDPLKSFGSTDFGNVSQLVPGIHPSVAIAAPGSAVVHSPQFCEAAVSEAGMQGLFDSAKALAMTAIDLLSSPELVAKVRAEFISACHPNINSVEGSEEG